MNGGDQIAEVLRRQGVRFLFTLCGGHISPILVGAKRRDIRVIDVRHEVNAVFAADAVARLTGIPGVAAVTAGPGVTNTITAIKNAQMAQSPVILLGGATATVLKGRGALQDIDQMALIEPHVKWATACTRVKDLVPTLEKAFEVAQEGVPGPVFVECPVDLLYPEDNVREFYGAKAASDTKSLPELALQGYLRAHLFRVFAGANKHAPGPRVRPQPPTPFPGAVERAAKLLREAKRPVFVLGSQATLQPEELPRLVAAIERLGVPVYLSGMARGLMGASHDLWFRHQRGKALREADLVLLAGVPCDFRMDYGLQINRKAKLIAVNRSEADAKKNRRPTLAVVADATELLCALAEQAGTPDDSPARAAWLGRLQARDDERNEQIAGQTTTTIEPMNPLAVVRAIDDALADDSVQVADGGDFVATASYVTRPRSPLSWLDPGAFGTLGVGAGFALGAKLCRPDAEVWILYGDGSAGYSIAEFDTFVRHGLPVIAVVGNDASWQQIARDQVVLLDDDVGTVLARSDYHRVVEGFGAKGFVVEREEDLTAVLAQAKEAAASGIPVLVNAHIGKSEFRKGSISM
ncbi:thiamine pyrophosphate-binding protein [Paraliomyxa miuraensis]|uniref:thiamine pyrophosphate-binding protein n=1 Tax=Paraliomyxa miuraensis TaxID=376150 RepID=UPI002256E6BE|nr:thiamine pyrophosphate-binding protein [Paraliomyxa miuraensis]MCX4242005.1 thiamine pyrophosphate-binding protein [Paraliomyxa miuraensis]